MTHSHYQEVLEKVEKTAAHASGARKNVCLICVSKTFDQSQIRPVLNDGARHFGENRVQEAKEKWPELLKNFDGITLHLIGPLQSNKVAIAVELFDSIHTIDRKKIAKTISEEMKKQNKFLQLFVQVNTGSEPQKAGVLPGETVEFVQACRSEYGLDISGLMCIPPFDENPGPHFALLRKLALESECENLSMGMSGDFETAVEFDASHLRVGSAIFGKR